MDGLSRLFLIALVAHVTCRWLDLGPARLSGAVATIALAGVVWARPLPRGAARWTKIPLVAGLALMGAGFVQPPGAGLTAEALKGAACLGIGVGVLGRAGRLFRRDNLPGAGVAVLTLAVAVGIARHPTVLPWQSAPDLNARTLAALLPAAALAVLAVAVNAALSSGRALGPAAAGLLAVLAFAAPLLPGVLADDRLRPRTRPLTQLPWTSIDPLSPRLDLATRLNDPSLRFPHALTYRVPVVSTQAGPDPQEKLSPDTVWKALNDVWERDTHPAPAIWSTLLFLGLTAITTTLFPYRE